MSQLWLVPVDEGSYEATLAQRVDLSDAPNKPEDFPDQARVCGINTDLEHGTWKRNRLNLKFMKTGDHCLIYQTDKHHYTASGRVGSFWRTSHVRDEYWGGGPALDVFAVEDFLELEIPRVTVNRILDYDLSYWPRGLSKVSGDRAIGRVLTHVALENASNTL